MGKISKREWDKLLGIHKLFQSVNEDVIKNYKKITPADVIRQVFDKHGVVCDGLVTIYQSKKSKNAYYLRLEYFAGETTYYLEPHSMPKGEGGFLKDALNRTKPKLLPNISSIVTKKDLKTVPWLSEMKTALIVPTISVTGDPATCILFAYKANAYSYEDLLSNITLTYAMTNILLNVLLRRKADNICSDLDEELKKIESIQRQLLPEKLPDVDGYDWAVHYSTCTRAGGDYYDFFVLSDDKIGVIIADVSGHGSPAAVVMAMTRLLLHTYPEEVSPPLAVLININNHLLGNILPGQFITAFYGVLDRTSKTLAYSNAGHTPPQLFRNRLHTIESLKTKKGMPLGIMSDGNFEQKSIGLNPEDIIVFYTDGLTEAMNKSKNMYGEKRLQKVLSNSFMKSSEGIKDAIIKDVNRFCKGVPLKDDLTLIVLKITK